ncbi:hypothetical protein Prudu_659S000100, partial [Prunus dulcis]
IEQKAVEKLINGKEIDLEELGGRVDQAQIQKTCISISGEDASSFYYVHSSDTAPNLGLHYFYNPVS